MNTLAILVITLVILLLINVPIAVSLGLAAVLAIIIPGEFPVSVIAQMFFTACDSYSLIAIPFFMLAGSLMELGGISERLINFADACVGHRRGGIGTVAVICCMIFAAISGSGPATVAALGGILIPAMVQARYDDGYAAALMATAGSIGIIIPPSIPMIVYAVQAEVSVSTMFMGGIIPGIIMGIALIILNRAVAKKRQYIGREIPMSRRERWNAFFKAVPALLMPVIILGGIYGGIFTATEAAGVAVVYGFFVGIFIYKDLKLKEIPKIFVKAAVSSASVMFIVMAASIFSYVIIVENVPGMVVEWATGIFESKFAMLVFINILLLIAGCFLDASSAIIILTPLLLPLAKEIGVNAYQFGIMMVFNLAIGLITPPVGLDLFVACNIAKISVSKIVRQLIPLLLVSLLVLLLVTYWPTCSLLLPRLLGANGV